MCQTSTEKITKKTQVMEEYAMFMDWKTQRCLIVSSPQIDIYFLCNHSQTPGNFFVCVGINKLLLKCIRKCKGLQITTTILKTNKIERFTLPRLLRLNKAVVVDIE